MLVWHMSTPGHGNSDSSRIYPLQLASQTLGLHDPPPITLVCLTRSATFKRLPQACNCFGIENGRKISLLASGKKESFSEQTILEQTGQRNLQNHYLVKTILTCICSIIKCDYSIYYSPQSICSFSAHITGQSALTRLIYSTYLY